MGPLICSPRFVQRPVAWGESEGIHFRLGPSVGYQYSSDTRWKCTRDTLLQTSEDLQGHSTMTWMSITELMKERTYRFLVSAVRRHLDRERLEANRDRVAKGLSGAGQPSAPAVEGKTGFIPKGYCVAWNKGGCSKDNCTYKHETPKPRDKGRKPSKTRGRSTDRSGSPKPKGKGKRICKFWKQGRCDRGADCNFLHEGSAGKPRQATPARSASGDSKNKKKTVKNSKRKGSRSSKSPKSPKSPKSKGSGASSS